VSHYEKIAPGAQLVLLFASFEADRGLGEATVNRREERSLRKQESCLGEPGSHEGQPGLSPQAVGNMEMSFLRYSWSIR